MLRFILSSTSLDGCLTSDDISFGGPRCLPFNYKPSFAVLTQKNANHVKDFTGQKVILRVQPWEQGDTNNCQENEL